MSSLIGSRSVKIVNILGNVPGLIKVVKNLGKVMRSRNREIVVWFRLAVRFDDSRSKAGLLSDSFLRKERTSALHKFCSGNSVRYLGDDMF